jgi:hypothetical protein
MGWVGAYENRFSIIFKKLINPLDKLFFELRIHVDVALRIKLVQSVLLRTCSEFKVDIPATPIFG